MTAVAVSGSIATQSHAAITYLTQDRRIVVDAAVNGILEGQFATAPDFGPFNSTRTHNLSQNRGTGIAFQNSSLLEDRIVMDGSARLTLLNGVIGSTVQSAAVSSRLDVSFLLDQPTSFSIVHLHALVSARFESVRTASAMLTGPSGMVFNWVESRDTPSTWPSSPFLGSVLPPGQYSLRLESLVISGSQVGTGLTESVLSFQMIVPGPPTAFVGIVGLAVCRARRRDG